MWYRLYACTCSRLFDVFARIDNGVINKFFWAGMVLLMPLMGLLLYWLFRPKRFNPWLEKEEPRYSLSYAMHR